MKAPLPLLLFLSLLAGSAVSAEPLTESTEAPPPDPRPDRRPDGPPCGIPCEFVPHGNRCSCQKPPAEEELRARLPPEIELQVFLAREAQGTPWHFKSRTKQQLAAAKKMLKDAKELAHFPPHRLIRLLYWNPAAGYPGSVSADMRILHDTRRSSFQTSSLDWMRRYRIDHPLDIDAMTDQERIAYVTELISMIPRRDYWGFTVKTMKKLGPRKYGLVYAPGHPLSKTPGKAVLEFDEKGAILPKGRLFSPGL